LKATLLSSACYRSQQQLAVPACAKSIANRAQFVLACQPLPLIFKKHTFMPPPSMASTRSPRPRMAGWPSAIRTCSF
jgi:hypothetical protein